MTLALVTDNHAEPEAPSWDNLRPATASDPCVVCWYSVSGYVPGVMQHIRRTIVTRETRCPAWWRSMLGDDASFRLLHYPDGTASSESRLMGEWYHHETPEPVVYEVSPLVSVQTPHGTMQAVLSPLSDAQGRPVYDVALAIWLPLLKRARATK